jgi:hypothetical protein
MQKDIDESISFAALGQKSLKCGPQSSFSGIAWEHAGHANSRGARSSSNSVLQGRGRHPGVQAFPLLSIDPHARRTVVTVV